MSNTAPVLSYYGDPAIKQKYVDRAQAHFDADEIVKGQYWDDGKGCAVGCLVHGSSHEKLAKELGIPLQMAYLIDRIFEGLPNGKAKEFPVRFVKAIPLGANLEKVMDRYFLALLSDPQQGVMLSANDSVRPQIQAVIDLYTRQVAEDYPSVEEWCAAYSAADSAAYSAADRAAYSAAYRAAYSAADSAAYSAAYRAADSAADRAAYRAAYSAADSAATYSNHILWQAELLLSLLQSAVPERTIAA